MGGVWGGEVGVKFVLGGVVESIESGGYVDG